MALRSFVPPSACRCDRGGGVSYQRGTLLSLLSLRLTSLLVDAPPLECVRELELKCQIRLGIGAVAFAITALTLSSLRIVRQRLCGQEPMAAQSEASAAMASDEVTHQPPPMHPARTPPPYTRTQPSPAPSAPRTYYERTLRHPSASELRLASASWGCRVGWRQGVASGFRRLH
jgi:hypothetical protein